MNLDPYNLHQYGAKVWSQFNEDGITLELVRRIQPPRSFAEVGAGHDGQNCSHVLFDQGWPGVWVESSPVHAAGLLPFCNENLALVVAHATTNNVGDLLLDLPTDFGVLSVDVDGQEPWLWKALTGSHWMRPSLVVIEFNGQVPLDEPYLQAEDPDYRWDHVSHDMGASLCTMIEIGEQLGYRFVGTASPTPQLDSPNAFFIRNDKVKYL